MVSRIHHEKLQDLKKHVGCKDFFVLRKFKLGGRGGGGIFKPISSIPLFSQFFAALSKHTAIENHVYIWQVNCGGTSQIWMWLKEFNMYFCKVETFA